MKDIVVVIYYIAKLLIDLVEEHKKVNAIDKTKHKKNRPRPNKTRR